MSIWNRLKAMFGILGGWEEAAKVEEEAPVMPAPQHEKRKEANHFEDEPAGKPVKQHNPAESKVAAQREADTMSWSPPDEESQWDDMSPFYLWRISVAQAGEWVVGTQDFDYAALSGGRGQHLGGNRESGAGRIALFHRATRVWTKDLERPNEAAVSNDGRCVACDWLFGGGLQSRFCGFDANGGEIFASAFAANLTGCGLTPEGEVAWCLTLASESESDANRLVFFSMESGKELFRTEFPCAEFQGLSNGTPGVSLEGAEIKVDVKGVGTMRFSPDGEWLNREELARAAAVKFEELASGYALMDHAYSLIGDRDPREVSTGEWERIRALLVRSDEGQVSDNTHARIHRTLGEFAETRGELSTAITHYSRALEWNPKVGVKQRMKKLIQQVSLLSGGTD